MKQTTTAYVAEGIRYKIVYYADQKEMPYTLYYYASEWESESLTPWRYCGDFENVNDALRYADKRSALLAGGDTVML